MRRFITRSLEVFSNIAIALIIMSSTASGATLGVGGAIVGFVVGLVVSVIAFGALFLLMDIADNTQRSADALASISLDRE